MRAWVLTDGDRDHETRCLGVAEAVADHIERRRVCPRAPWSWLAPFGPIDPRDAPGSAGGPITPARGWPDVVIAAGRGAAPYLAHVKRATRSRAVTVFLGDTIAGSGVADIVAAPPDARVQGPNVIAAVTGPHRMSAVRLAAARGGPPLISNDVIGLRVGALLGAGRRKRGAWSTEDVARLAASLARLRQDGAVLLCAPRRDATAALDVAVRELAHYLWDRTGADPLTTLLARSEAFVVAADDALAIDEAVSTGKPVMTFRPSHLGRSDAAAADRLEAVGATRPFAGRVERYSYAALDSTPEVARAISAIAATRAALSPRARPRLAARARETNGPTTR